jgi:acetolactate synthase-1/2/3 large subunit
MRVADFVISRLKEAGVDHIYGVVGGGCIFLCDAVAKSGIKFVACHHEQAAAMAAEGYARAGERLGAVLVTSGPGGTNAITGVLGAWTDHAPVIVLSGQSFVNQTIGDTGVRTLGVQEINIVEIVRSITKYAVMITDPLEIRAHLEKAIHLATTGRLGPCWLDLPANVQNAEFVL